MQVLVRLDAFAAEAHACCLKAQVLDVCFATGAQRQRVISQLERACLALHRQAAATRPNFPETDV
jgi:hypothetical protein